MATHRYNVEIPHLVNLAIDDHKRGYEIEAFSILYECIRYNQSHLISVKTKKPIKIKKYKELQAAIKKNTILNKKYLSNIGRFHTNRGKVVHEIILKKTIDDNITDKLIEQAGKTMDPKLKAEWKQAERESSEFMKNMIIQSYN